MLYERFILELQGVRLRVVGLCDSKSLLVASDVYSMELDDSILLEVCRVKSNGSSLVTLASSGISHTLFLLMMNYKLPSHLDACYIEITFVDVWIIVFCCIYWTI